MKSSKNLYLNASKTVVVIEGDPLAAYLLVVAGKEFTKPEIDAGFPEGNIYDLAVKAAEKANAESPPEATQLPAEGTPPPEATQVPAETDDLDDEDEAESKEVDGPAEDKSRRGPRRG